MRRRLTRREKRRKNKQIIIISTVCLLLILGVGYAAFNTNLSITAKGNIKENSIDITDNIVTEGDGLYKDIYEEGRYIYRGQDPDNYIWFNEELWRIIAKETDGTYKIIKEEPLANRAFDSTGSRTTGYCSYRLTWGCNAWNSSNNLVNGSYQGIVEKQAELNAYLNNEYYTNIINDTAKNQIVSHIWNVGIVTNNNDNLLQQIQSEKAIIWEGNIGLISISDYLKANTNTTQCETFSLNNNSYENCRTTNWLYLQGVDWHTISLYSNYMYIILNVNSDGLLTGDYASEINNAPRPVVFLKSSTKLTGNGTRDKPYQIL